MHMRNCLARPFNRIAITLAVLMAAVSAWDLKPATAQPAPPPGVNAMVQAFQSWASNNGIGNSALVISRDGAELAASSVGSWTPDTVAPIASTSKAITGLCIMALADQGRIALTDSIGRHLSTGFVDSLTATGRTNAGQITIEQLLRHTSGFQGNGNATPPREPTQAQYAAGAADAHPDQWFSRQVLDRALLTTPGTTFAYANVNYALLSVVIENVTGETYENFCRRTVLAPHGAGNAVIVAGNAAMGAFGGWSISAREYSNFYSRGFLRSALSQNAADFMDRALDATCGAACSYGLGVFVVPAGYSVGIATVPLAAGKPPALLPVFHTDLAPYELNHNGDWSSSDTTPNQFSSFAIYWSNGVSAVMICDRGNIGAALGNFYAVMSAAALTIN
jgi:CubicO group peptidase (beta-lactamase class C family)